MEISAWDRVYQQQGQVQFDILPKVKIAANKFARKGYRRVLDLACGTGRHAIYLAKEGFEVHAGDISEHGLLIAQRNALTANVKIEFKRYDMEAIPYPDNFFDAIICVWSIDIGTLGEVTKRIDEIFRVLKYQGMLVTDFISADDDTYRRGIEIEENTFKGAMEGLPDLIEHYSTKRELINLFSRFHQAAIEDVDHFYSDALGQEHTIKALDVEAIK